MEPLYKIEDVNDWFSNYTYDHIRLDVEGKIDAVRRDSGIDYIIEQDIHLPKLDTEYEYISYLTGKYIHKDFAKHLEQLVGYNLQEIVIDEVTVNNVLAFNDPRGTKVSTGYKSAFEAGMEATMDYEYELVDAITETMEVIRTLVHNKGEQKIRPVIRIK